MAATSWVICSFAHLVTPAKPRHSNSNVLWGWSPPPDSPAVLQLACQSYHTINQRLYERMWLQKHADRAHGPQCNNGPNSRLPLQEREKRNFFLFFSCRFVTVQQSGYTYSPCVGRTELFFLGFLLYSTGKGQDGGPDFFTISIKPLEYEPCAGARFSGAHNCSPDYFRGLNKTHLYECF